MEGRKAASVGQTEDTSRQYREALLNYGLDIGKRVVSVIIAVGILKATGVF